MGMTMTQKILAKHAGLESVCAGQLIEANVDLTLANDITGPVAIREMEKELGISYPTVRARLDQILAALGLEANPGKEKPARKEVLEMLAQGEITQEQALDMLKKP